MSKNITRVVGAISLIVLVGFLNIAQAGKITIDGTATTPGYGGWNLDNIDVVVKDILESIVAGDFDKSDGSYTKPAGADPASGEYFTFDSNIYSTSTPIPPIPINLMGVLHGKDWPVGEPPGIKIVNDDTGNIKPPKPVNCILTTSYLDTGYLNATTPHPTLCSSPFQSHKRFKVNMGANSLGKGIDIVLNVEPETGARDYQVFQKINNYTGKRLKGFIVQVGTGIGMNFETVGESVDANSGFAGMLSLNKTLMETIWAAEEFATFSRGLFGPMDTIHVPPHFPTDGFFDVRPAGFYVESTTSSASGTIDTFQSTIVMPSNYTVVPVPGATDPADQFGPWLHSTIIPTAIFFDDDEDSTTDAAIQAWWGAVGDGSYNWMYGNGDDHNITTDDFLVVDPAVISGWASNPLYFTGPIEDLLNLGLNYIVTIGTVDSNWPTWDGDSSTASFTIRMIPIEDDSGIVGNPGYIDTPPTGFIPDDLGTVTVSPSPAFDIGDDLTITVADGNTTTAPVGVKNLTTNEVENSTEHLTLAGVFQILEIEPDRRVFEGQLPTSANPATNADNDGIMYVQSGHTLEITYTDTNPSSTVSVTTTAGGSTNFYVIPTPQGTVVFPLGN